MIQPSSNASTICDGTAHQKGLFKTYLDDVSKESWAPRICNRIGNENKKNTGGKIQKLSQELQMV